MSNFMKPEINPETNPEAILYHFECSFFGMMEKAWGEPIGRSELSPDDLFELSFYHSVISELRASLYNALPPAARDKRSRTTTRRHHTKRWEKAKDSLYDYYGYLESVVKLRRSWTDI